KPRHRELVGFDAAVRDDDVLEQDARPRNERITQTSDRYRFTEACRDRLLRARNQRRERRELQYGDSGNEQHDRAGDGASRTLASPAHLLEIRGAARLLFFATLALGKARRIHRSRTLARTRLRLLRDRIVRG